MDSNNSVAGSAGDAFVNARDLLDEVPAETRVKLLEALLVEICRSLEEVASQFLIEEDARNVAFFSLKKNSVTSSFDLSGDGEGSIHTQTEVDLLSDRVLASLSALIGGLARSRAELESKMSTATLAGNVSDALTELGRNASYQGLTAHDVLQSLDERFSEVAELTQRLVDEQGESARLFKVSLELKAKLKSRTTSLEKTRTALKAERAKNTRLRNSLSWKLTMPIRFISSFISRRVGQR